MSNSMNKVILVGNLGQDPELRHYDRGARLKLRLATTKVWNDRETGERNERTDWHNVTLWGKRAEALGSILRKGEKVMVEGRLETRSYQDADGNKKYATEVKADNVILTGTGRPSDTVVREMPIGAGRKMAASATA